MSEKVKTVAGEATNENQKEVQIKSILDIDIAELEKLKGYQKLVLTIKGNTFKGSIVPNYQGVVNVNSATLVNRRLNESDIKLGILERVNNDVQLMINTFNKVLKNGLGVTCHALFIKGENKDGREYYALDIKMSSKIFFRFFLGNSEKQIIDLFADSLGKPIDYYKLSYLEFEKGESQI